MMVGTIMSFKTIHTRRSHIKINIRIINLKNCTISKNSHHLSMLYPLFSLMSSQIESYSQCLTFKCKVLSIQEIQRQLEEPWAGKVIKVCPYLILFISLVVQELIATIDPNQNGKLVFDEFLLVLRYIEERQIQAHPHSNNNNSRLSNN